MRWGVAAAVAAAVARRGSGSGGGGAAAGTSRRTGPDAGPHLRTPPTGAGPTAADTPAAAPADPTADAISDDVIDLTDAPGPGRRNDGAGAAVSAAGGAQAMRPSEIPRDGWLEIAKRTGKEVGADKVPMMAAAVAFAGLLALFPAMVAVISVYGLVTDPGSAAERAASLTSALPADAASLITDQLQAVAQAEETALGLALVTSILGALWSASGGVGMLINAVNIAYDEQDDRGFVKNKGLALVLTLGAVVFFVVAITLIAVVPGVLDGLGLGIVGTIAAQVARWVLLAGLIALALAVLYRYAPDRADARWRWISPGAVVAAVLWLLGSWAFSAFVNDFGSYNETYGAVAGVIVLMLWLQISALVVLVGAELNAEIERQTRRDTTTGTPQPMGQRGATPADELPSAEDDPAAASPWVDADDGQMANR